MSTPPLPPAPVDTPLADSEGRPAPVWARWLNLLRSLLVPEPWRSGTGEIVHGPNWQDSDTSGRGGLAMRKGSDGKVHLTGAINRVSGASTTMFTIANPEYRPDRVITVVAWRTGTLTSFDLGTDGVATHLGGSTDYVYLDGVSFYPEGHT